MDLPRDSTMQYATGAALVGILIAFVLFLPNSLAQWLRKKNYQYEVTFALYMLTPTEKFVFSKFGSFHTKVSKISSSRLTNSAHS